MKYLKELAKEFPDLIKRSGAIYYIDGQGWYRQRTDAFGLWTWTRWDDGSWTSCNFDELVMTMYQLHGDIDKYRDYMFRKANEVIKNWTRDGEDDLWHMANEWNRFNDDSEIFMCELCDENNHINGFMIEDDTFYYQEEV